VSTNALENPKNIEQVANGYGHRKRSQHIGLLAGLI